MNAPDLIQEVRSSGGSIWVEKDRLELDIPDSFPERLIEELRDHKTEIINELSERYGDGELPPNDRPPADETEERRVIARLQSGQTWLLDQHHKWRAGNLSAATGAEFSRVWNAWWELDELLRTDYEFQGCVYGPDGTCPEGFPCLGCSDLLTPAVVAQLALT